MVHHSGISYLTSHCRLGLRKGCKFFPSQKQRHRRQPRPRPDWDEAKTNLFRCRHLHRSSSCLEKAICFSDETEALKHPKGEHLNERGFSAANTPAVEFQKDCKGITPSNEEESQYNLGRVKNLGCLIQANTSVPAASAIDQHGNISNEDSQHPKATMNVKHETPNCMRKLQKGKFPKTVSNKDGQLFRQKNQDVTKCKPLVRKLQGQESQKKIKEQRSGLGNVTCLKTKSCVPNNTGKTLVNIKCRDSKIAKRYHSSIQRTIPTGKCASKKEESHGVCELSKIELQYLRQEIRMYLKGQQEMLKELKDFKYVTTCKLENIQFEIQRLSKSQLERIDSPHQFMEAPKENPISPYPPHKDTDEHLEDRIQLQESSREVASLKKAEEIQHTDPPKPREIPEFLKQRNLNPQNMSAKERQSVTGSTSKAISTDAMHSLQKKCLDSTREMFGSQLISCTSNKNIPRHSTENEVNHPKDVLGSSGTHRGKNSEESSIMSSFSSWFSGSCFELHNDWEGRSDTNLRDINTTTSKLESTKTQKRGQMDVNGESDTCEFSGTTTSQDNNMTRQYDYPLVDTSRVPECPRNDIARDCMHNDTIFYGDSSKVDNTIPWTKKSEVVSISEQSFDKFDRDDATDILGMSSDSSLHYWEDNKNCTKTKSSLDESETSLVQTSVSSLGMLLDGRSKANFLANEPSRENYVMFKGEMEQLQNLCNEHRFKTGVIDEKRKIELHSSRLLQALHSVNTLGGMDICQTEEENLQSSILSFFSKV